MKTLLLLIMSLLFIGGCTTQQADNEAYTAEPITGFFQYMADAPLITLCTSGKRYPVTMEGAYIELERAYLESGIEPSRKAWVQIRGQLRERPAMEGEGKRSFFIIDQFDSIDPDRQCVSQESNRLEGREWQLVEMPGIDLNIPKEKPPTLSFDQKEKRVTGLGGCNRFFGSYELDSERLEIGPLGSTRISCGELDLIENKFLVKLEQAHHWQVTDEKLSLFNANQMLLVFRSP